MLYHAKFSVLANGYLGVDIFFVISGFLITSIVLKGLEANSFSFSYFYQRRAKRLLPALYSTLAFVTFASYLFLTDRQWEDYRSQLYGAISFTSNLVLPLQVGYFENAAETKPLLHIWSLSLEEQYYLLLPLILFLVRPANRGLVLFGLALLSLIFCQILVSNIFELDWLPRNDGSVWAFYLLPTRAWQLLAGSLVAWQMFARPQTSVPKIIKLISLGGLLILLCISIDDVPVRGNAIAATLLTAVLVMGRDDWLPRWSPVAAIERMGDWSYSLYLIHWPMLVFAHIAFLGRVPSFVNVVIVVASILLAYFQYHFVEQRFRGATVGNARGAVVLLLLSSLCLIVASLPVTVGLFQADSKTILDFKEFRRTNYGFERSCARGNSYMLPDKCKNSSSPRVAVWGDSYAMHLIPGLLKNEKTKDSLVQITRSNCNPIRGLTEARVGAIKAKLCVDFNTGAIDYMLSSKSIETVIISSPFGYFYGGKNKYYFDGEVIDRDPSFALEVFTKNVQELLQRGKRVIIFSPLPSADFEVGECLERLYTGAVVFGRNDCEIDFDLHKSRTVSVIRALEFVQKETGAQVVWFSDHLCQDSTCQPEVGSLPLYRDRGHMSIKGSEVLVGQMRIF